MKNVKHNEQNIKVEITKKCKERRTNAFCKNLEETTKRRWKKSRESWLHLLGLREAAPTTNNAKYFTHLHPPLWIKVINTTYHLVYKHPFCEVTPPTKNETQKIKNIKHSEQNIKVDITKKDAKFAS